MDTAHLNKLKSQGIVPMTWPLFKEGELLEIKGVFFRIEYINAGKTTMSLRPTSCEGKLAEALFARD